MAWNKLKSMFVVSDQPAQSTDDVLKDLEKYQLPEGEVGDAARRDVAADAVRARSISRRSTIRPASPTPTRSRRWSAS